MDWILSRWPFYRLAFTSRIYMPNAIGCAISLHLPLQAYHSLWLTLWYWHSVAADSTLQMAVVSYENWLTAWRLNQAGWRTSMRSFYRPGKFHERCSISGVQETCLHALFAQSIYRDRDGYFRKIEHCLLENERWQLILLSAGTIAELSRQTSLMLLKNLPSRSTRSYWRTKKGHQRLMEMRSKCHYTVTRTALLIWSTVRILNCAAGFQIMNIAACLPIRGFKMLLGD